MRVYVGGVKGYTPTVVATTLEWAMEQTIKDFRIGGEGDVDGVEPGEDPKWTCWLVDGDVGILRCEIVLNRPSGIVSELYVEAYDVAVEPETGPSSGG